MNPESGSNLPVLAAMFASIGCFALIVVVIAGCAACKRGKRKRKEKTKLEEDQGTVSGTGSLGEFEVPKDVLKSTPSSMGQQSRVDSSTKNECAADSMTKEQAVYFLVPWDEVQQCRVGTTTSAQFNYITVTNVGHIIEPRAAEVTSEEKASLKVPKQNLAGTERPISATSSRGPGASLMKSGSIRGKSDRGRVKMALPV